MYAYTLITANFIGNELCFSVAQPFIITPMDNTTVAINEGINRNFTCEATGYPVPTVIWHRVNGNLSSRVSISSAVQSEDGSVSANLMITNASREDTGVYTCTANNSNGIDSRDIRIIRKYVANNCMFIISIFVIHLMIHRPL